VCPPPAASAGANVALSGVDAGSASDAAPAGSVDPVVDDPVPADAVVDDAMVEGNDVATEVDEGGNVERVAGAVVAGTDAVVEEKMEAGADEVVGSAVAGSMAPSSTEPATKMNTPARLNHDCTGAPFRRGPDA